MIFDTTYRVAIVGASSLAGKELSDALSESAFAASNFTLLDEDAATGQIATAGDEISVIQKIDGASFERMDLIFFAGESGNALRYWSEAKRSGAAIIDLTLTLEGQDGVPVWSPWTARTQERNTKLTLETTAVVSAHPAAILLALPMERIASEVAVRSVTATLLEPASQYGRPAMDELHQQTVSLLSFQSLPREQYDAQAAFNLLSSLGGEAKIKLEETEARVRRHYTQLSNGPAELALQLIHAPVFHGYVASVFVELENEASGEEVEAALLGDHIQVVSRETEPPSNLISAGQEDIMVRVETAEPGSIRSRRFKLLLAADNLKLAAANAIGCARELAQLRPLGKVQ